ncbi:biotin-dependent carboxyltransferase family protein [Demequina pelophila]|uniref:5-oxoprolinase subunit C family protein n=1 Tax=Demequina pelophila TaxID=1638984 RepID=UPI000785A7B6|nr:biotin-dependent carboxyltransferase family protein [Demequina pelophila]
MSLELLRAGALTTVQDLGRPGFAHQGVPRSGALDLEAHGRANALVGNTREAATLETTALGCTLRVRSPRVVAVTGARCDVFVGGVRAPWGAPVRLAPGQVLEVGPAVAGLRSYVAVSGGIAVEPVLGSRSTDLLTGLGPAPLRDGDTVPLGPSGPVDDALFGRARGGADGGAGGGADGGDGEVPGTRSGAGSDAHADPLVLPLHPGPRADWITASSLGTLVEAVWTVSGDSNRVGVRLEGAALERARDHELASEGMVWGAVQVPPSGRPVVFLADHPTTGGYPVVGVVDPAARSALAQARPGDRVRFEARPR